MEKEAFLDAIRLNVLENHALALSEAEAGEAVQVTLQTVAEQLTPDEKDIFHFLRAAAAMSWK
jgi:hypothetical protein